MPNLAAGPNHPSAPTWPESLGSVQLSQPLRTLEIYTDEVIWPACDSALVIRYDCCQIRTCCKKDSSSTHRNEPFIGR